MFNTKYRRYVETEEPIEDIPNLQPIEDISNLKEGERVEDLDDEAGEFKDSDDELDPDFFEEVPDNDENDLEEVLKKAEELKLAKIKENEHLYNELISKEAALELEKK
jgi:hypothetical protein